MEGGRSRRELIVVLALSAIVAGVALALVLSAGDDGDETAATTATATAETTETATTETATETTATTETTAARRQDQEDVEQTVVTFVEQSEQSDPQACEQLTAGGGALEDCAAAAGINLRALPSSDELQIDDVDVSGNRATATLSNGSSFSLRQAGGRWKISGFRPQGQPGGGERAPGQGGPGGPAG